MKWLDYHTHREGCERYMDNPNVLVIQSLQLGEAPHPRADYCTIGIHPTISSSQEWLLKDAEYVRELLVSSIKKSPIPAIAIGECGWDKRSGLTEEEQNRLMAIQIEVAKELHLPLIIHNVSYWHLLLKFQKMYPYITFVVHGFRGNQALAQQLIAANIHLSLHPHFLTHSDYFPSSFFIETDEVDSELASLYSLVSEKLHIPVQQLQKDIINGFYNLHLL